VYAFAEHRDSMLGGAGIAPATDQGENMTLSGEARSMARCAMCGEDISTRTLRLSEDALLMLRIADHMLQLWGLPRERTKSSAEERGFALGGDLPSWFTFAHVGRIHSSALHDAAHSGDTEPFKTNEWLRVAKRYCLVGLDRTLSGQALRDQIPADRSVPEEDGMLAAQMAEANVKINEGYFSG
jgi:hypothetical protein